MFLGEIGGEIKFEGERLYKGEDIFIFLFGILNFETFFGMENYGKLLRVYIYIWKIDCSNWNYICVIDLVIWKINRDVKIIFILS